MDKSAIQQIQDSANIPRLVQQLEDAGPVTPVILTPASMSLESLEKHMPEAARFRLHLKTGSLPDFISYNNAYADADAQCFISAKNMTANTIFDLGTVENPLHKEHKATLQLEKTAAYQAVCDVDGLRMGQKDAAEFVEEWADNIKATSKTGEAMTPAQAAAKLRDLTITQAREVNSKVHDFGVSMSAMEIIEAKDQDLIPGELLFTCAPYNSFESREFKLRVGLLTGGDKPEIKLRILQVEAIKEVISEEFKTKLEAAFGGLPMKSFIGEV
jgi:uncharacterized protein YfdQ (DUF2303 family)